jgi:diguanylate cyclase (GGDEF)-like protein/PAS domain S-box-containing protein
MNKISAPALRPGLTAAQARRILAASPAATIVTDRAGLISYLNQAAAALLGYDPADSAAAHSRPFTFTPDEFARRAASPLRGAVEDSEWTLRRADGAAFEAQVTIGPLRDKSGNIVGLVLVLADITARKREAAALFHLAHHDPLTGLPTRRLLNQTLESRLRARAAGRDGLALLMVDLDNVKQVNDAFGHQSGDALIIHAASCLRGALRQADMVARIGGDEFLVLLDHVPHRAAAERAASKLAEALHTPKTLGARRITPRASIGIALFPNHGTTAEKLLQHADAAMYRVKAAGGDGWLTFTDDLAASLARQRAVEAALHEALELDEFRLVYQPQLSLADGAVNGVEAFLRWNSRSLGEMLPGEFIPAAERCGLIGPIGEFVLRTACHEGRALQNRLGRELTIAVNLSPQQCEAPDLPEFLFRTLAETGLPAGTLELEITETLLARESSAALAALRAARTVGVHIAVDDVCTGFGSLAAITRLPVDRLKIDRSFVGALHSRHGGAVIATIIALARSLKIATVAEGIETASQHDTLLSAGCREGQGFYYAPPVGIAALPTRIRQAESSFRA